MSRKPILHPVCIVLLAAEETFGGGNLRGPNIQPIATTLIY
jgi:hypothetical protein